MNRIPDTVFWPERINGHLTHFGGAGLKLDKPMEWCWHEI